MEFSETLMEAIAFTLGEEKGRLTVAWALGLLPQQGADHPFTPGDSHASAFNEGVRQASVVKLEALREVDRLHPHYQALMRAVLDIEQRKSLEER